MATARASEVASGGSCESRARTDRTTPWGPISRTCAAWSAGGGFVGQVKIVEREHEGLGGGEFGGQREEAVRGCDRGIGFRGGRVGKVVAAEEGSCQSSRPTQDFPPLRLPSPSKGGLEQLA